ncbi:putative aspartyl protease [Salinibacter ruber]|uniref:Aspartyl protease n=1 Tax=Salinibacter ruber TaxID=146919 RepID=A0A9X2ZU11_9BACT|nr:putative aspartyl protease [Salinibacter ruber]
MTPIGRVTGDREVVVPLLVRAQNGADRQVDALLDTGFNGYLALPAHVIESLELHKLGREQVTLASGEIHLVGKYEATLGFGGAIGLVE